MSMPINNSFVHNEVEPSSTACFFWNAMVTDSEMFRLRPSKHHVYVFMHDTFLQKYHGLLRNLAYFDRAPSMMFRKSLENTYLTVN